MIVETTGTYCIKNICYLRKKYAISRRGLAKLIGMSEYTLKEMEEELRNPVFLHQQLERLCDIFEVSLEELLHKDLSGEL
ncbi:MAG: helix-turn-helix transcriptional regulator [Oscillospiraceae bacterium]|nr:helix-turn-helix transcriptional regulator [Oscillospiraceae bacterium]